MPSASIATKPPKFGWTSLCLTIAASGAALKWMEILFWKTTHLGFAGRLILQYDPAAVSFAEHAVKIFFNNKGIAPVPGASTLYGWALVVGFTFECLLLGVAVRLATTAFETRRSDV